MSNDLYILTRAHFYGDHCDVFGVFTSFTLATQAREKLLETLPDTDDNLLFEITYIKSSNINKIIKCDCDNDTYNE